MSYQHCQKYATQIAQAVNATGLNLLSSQLCSQFCSWDVSALFAWEAPIKQAAAAWFQVNFQGVSKHSPGWANCSHLISGWQRWQTGTYPEENLALPPQSVKEVTCNNGWHLSIQPQTSGNTLWLTSSCLTQPVIRTSPALIKQCSPTHLITPVPPQPQGPSRAFLSPWHPWSEKAEAADISIPICSGGLRALITTGLLIKPANYSKNRQFLCAEKRWQPIYPSWRSFRLSVHLRRNEFWLGCFSLVFNLALEAFSHHSLTTDACQTDSVTNLLILAPRILLQEHCCLSSFSALHWCLCHSYI